MTSDQRKVQQAQADAPAADGPVPPLSKNQQKKLLKAVRYADRKKEKKEIEKAARLELQEERRAEGITRLAGMSEEEKLKWREEKAVRVGARKQTNQDKRARLQQALEKGQRVIVDLSFERKMTDSELKSLCQQLAYCYSANARSSKPMHLIFTGVQGRMKECINKQCSGFDNWFATKSEDTYLVHFEKEKEQLVYLTADSENEIQELDPSKIYIVGGIVDRNRYKNLCAGKAEEEGIATAKLPIGEYVALSSSSVMCTNHVVEIIIRQQELGDWQAAFEAVIPTRKRKAGETSDAVKVEDDPALEETPCLAACAPAQQKETQDKAAAKTAAARKPSKKRSSLGN